MPMRARSLGRLVLRSPTEMPSTVIAPSWNGSSPLTHLISVDLPDPEGPHTTTTSPLATAVEQRLSTCVLPYHLLPWSIVIMAAPATLVSSEQTLADDRGPALQPPHALGGGERDHEIDRRG